jgi:hypothetical protein
LIYVLRLNKDTTRSVSLVAALPMSFLSLFSVPICFAWLGNRTELSILSSVMTLAATGALLHITTGPGTSVFRCMGQIGNEFIYHALTIGCLALSLLVIWRCIHLVWLMEPARPNKPGSLGNLTCADGILYCPLSLIDNGDLLMPRLQGKSTFFYVCSTLRSTNQTLGNCMNSMSRLFLSPILIAASFVMSACATSEVTNIPRNTQVFRPSEKSDKVELD